MSEYTPTTEEIRRAVTSFNEYLDHPRAAEFDGDLFDRWLAEVKATEREDCVNHVKFLYCSHHMEYKPYQEAVDDIVEVLTGKEDGSEVFEKWLAEVKAQAWEQGATTIVATIVMNGSNDMPRNPYRQGEEQ